jgi:hypothetical protein
MQNQNKTTKILNEKKFKKNLLILVRWPLALQTPEPAHSRRKKGSTSPQQASKQQGKARTNFGKENE